MDGQTDRVTDTRRQFRAMVEDYVADRESTIVQLRALLRELVAIAPYDLAECKRRGSPRPIECECIICRTCDATGLSTRVGADAADIRMREDDAICARWWTAQEEKEKP